MNTTIVIVNYKTFWLTRDCYTSLRRWYPTVPVILIDNGSGNASTEYIRSKAGSRTTIILNEENLGHGPALHQGMEEAKTRFVFTMDSDCVVLRGGFLEAMEKRLLAYSTLYAVGDIWDERDGLKYLHPWSALWRKSMYDQIRPFAHRGAPAIHNMVDAREREFRVDPFPIAKYVEHRWMGVRGVIGWDDRADKIRGIVDTIHGLVDEDELRFLYQVVKMAPTEGTIIDLGTFQGRSAAILCLASHWERVVTVDNHLMKHHGENTIDLAKRNLHHGGFYPRIHDGPSYVIPSGIDRVAALFVDTDHRECALKRELDAWLPHLAPQGIVAMHDYGMPTCPTMKPFIDKFFTEGEWERLGVVKWLIAFRKKVDRNTPQQWNEVYSTRPDHYKFQGRDCIHRVVLNSIPPESKILDVGGGMSRFSHLAKEAGHIPYVVDYSSVAIDLLKSHGIQAQLLDIREWDGVPLGEFDLAFCTEFLEHLVDPKVALDFLVAHVGWAFFSVPNPAKADYSPYHVRDFQRDELESLLEEYWRQVAVRNISTYWFAEVKC